MNFHHRNITVMGLGRHGGGVAAVAYLARCGARVTVTDLATEATLQDSLAQLAGENIHRYRLGEHVEEDFRAADAVVVNPAVRHDNRWVRIAREAGTEITSEIELFLRACPARVVGVTGSNGKSTTAAMIAACLEAAGRRTFLGGNIGRSLLPDVERMDVKDIAVLELSSFQLAWLSETCVRPELAVLTNFSTNHLDWHGTLDAYREAKRNIARRDETKALFLGPLDFTWHEWANDTATVPTPIASQDIPPLHLPGEHNRLNAALAVSVAVAVGCDRELAPQAVAEFTGLPHRLESLGEWQGRAFINDSQATTPEATIAALQASDRPARLLVGGADKGCCRQSLAKAIVQHAASCACYGSTGPAIAAAIRTEQADFLLQTFASLHEAAAWQWNISQPGDCLLLSPACGSLDQFADYAARAAAFRAFVDRIFLDTPETPPETTQDTRHAR